ncbi:cell division protein [Serinicoccus hydrothermalis]|uniref:Cell wall synthesis protein Wag31 n=1 Tax=Serinicoccus hydrothermalis TaxID=1758689 RepID=A0A1B1NA21_9MICO|nr:DivIVA domain-containing protein [Serinicoccus hydrothermalis]ANS78266.1 cell division protein [Serinicoccus hydrothermalis]
MALSPEDVIKKSFSATHLRRGYDETQVDDFLDEVVVELRRLVTENDGLRTDLEDCRAGGGSMRSVESRPEGEAEQDAGAPKGTDAVATDAGAADADVESLRRQLEECRQARVAAEESLAAAQEQVASAERERDELRASRNQDMDTVAAVQGGASEQKIGDGEDPSSIISLAQRLHDQHVAEGESTKARLIEEGDGYRASAVAEADERSAELQRTGQETHDRLLQEGQTQHDELVRTGQETHDRLVEEGQTQHDELVRTGQETHDRLVGEGETSRDQMVSEAEGRRASVLEDLHGQEAALGSTISNLQGQERDLRQRLRTFLADQMERVDATGPTSS